MITLGFMRNPHNHRTRKLQYQAQTRHPPSSYHHVDDDGADAVDDNDDL